MDSARTNGSIAVALVALLAIGLWLRLDGNAERTISHIESYAPGIAYPAGFSDPPARLDQRANLLWAINDVHGPFWYLWMLPYAQLFGTDLATLRLPAALCGVATILGVFLLGKRAGGAWAGLAAAALLTGAGHQVYWSQRARFYASAICLAVWTTVWLLDLLDRKSFSPGRLAALLAGSFAGLATLYYYWPLFLAQLLWTALAEAKRGLRLTLWLAVLGLAASPLLTLAVYQARPAPYLAYPTAETLAGYFSFGFLYDPAIDDGVIERGQVGGRELGLAVGAVLLALALASRGSAPRVEPSGAIPAPPLWLAALATASCTLLILASVGPAAEAFPHKTRLLWATAAFPALGLAAFAALAGRGGELLRRIAKTGPTWLGSPVAALFMLALGPLAMVTAVHEITPFFAPRGMALFSPFLLALCGVGLARLARSGGAGALAAAGLLVAMVGVQAASIRIVHSEPGAFDYRRMALEVREHMGPEDRIFVGPHWSVTPLFYYWRNEADRLVGDHWAQAAGQTRRVWLVEAERQPLPADMLPALAGWRQSEQLSARALHAKLFERP
ncbi:MAG: hypothetical protein GC160_10795 [Acidobacteria bacterium]|nr:hypothetical protein [Acidobacteriota bacterium]